MISLINRNYESSLDQKNYKRSYFNLLSGFAAGYITKVEKCFEQTGKKILKIQEKGEILK